MPHLFFPLFEPQIIIFDKQRSAPAPRYLKGGGGPDGGVNSNISVRPHNTLYLPALLSPRAGFSASSGRCPIHPVLAESQTPNIKNIAHIKYFLSGTGFAKLLLPLAGIAASRVIIFIFIIRGRILTLFPVLLRRILAVGRFVVPVLLVCLIFLHLFVHSPAVQKDKGQNLVHMLRRYFCSIAQSGVSAGGIEQKDIAPMAANNVLDALLSNGVSYFHRHNDFFQHHPGPADPLPQILIIIFLPLIARYRRFHNRHLLHQFPNSFPENTHAEAIKKMG